MLTFSDETHPKLQWDTWFDACPSAGRKIIHVPLVDMQVLRGHCPSIPKRTRVREPMYSASERDNGMSLRYPHPIPRDAERPRGSLGAVHASAWLALPSPHLTCY